MSIKPFTFNMKRYESDPDQSIEELEQWFESFMPVYYESEEFRQLSKANQKSGGQMFHMFMELNLNYLGNNLAQVDKAATKEILVNLFPRKLMCSDAQAKTIVPELIACWECLQRVIDGNSKKPTLRHTSEVIQYLKSIKKDYLNIYNRTDLPAAAQLNHALLEEIMEEEEFEADWVFDLIADAVENLDTILQRSTPLDHWFRLCDYDELGVFLHEICVVEGIEEYESEAVAALLGFALQSVFSRIRQGEKEAAEFWRITEQNLLNAYEEDELDSESMIPLLGVLASYRQYLSDEFVEFVQQWQAGDNEAKHPDDNFSLHDLKAICLSILEDVPDEFDFVQVWQDQMGFIPPEGMQLVAEQMLSIGDPRFGDYLALLILDEREDIAIAMADLLASHPHCITPLTLDRMIRVRNWLAENVRKSVDKLILNARKKVLPDNSAINSAPNIDAWMTTVDGSGAQGVMLMVKEPGESKAFRLVNFVLKEAVGIIGISVTPPGTKTRLLKIISMARQQAGVFEKVSTELVYQQIPLFIALNLKSKITIGPELVQGMELLGLQDWNPGTSDIKNLFSDYLMQAGITQAPSEKEVADVQKRSEKWPDSPLGDSWLINDMVEYTVKPDGSTQDPVQIICNNYLEPEKDLWRERMMRLSLWASQCDSKRRQKQARDFAVLGWLLDQGIPVRDIKMMEVIAGRSV